MMKAQTPMHLTSLSKRWRPLDGGAEECLFWRSALAEWIDGGCRDESRREWIANGIEAMQKSRNLVYQEWRASWPERFLPVEAFKFRDVRVSGVSGSLAFKSSGTTLNQSVATHVLDDTGWYDAISLAGFEWFYGAIGDWEVLALLPGYMERGQSSLVHMARNFRRASGTAAVDEGFHLGEFDRLTKAVELALEKGKRVLVIGVTYAVLDWCESLEAQPIRGDLSRVVIMETGGMKGTRAEWTREALHQHIKAHSGVKAVHSEYGMTELMSQAYAQVEGRFRCPPWMQVVIGDPGDPKSWSEIGVRGRIHIIDLANIHSCSFLATGDAGRLHEDGTFEVLGRFDAADVRGCNLMVQ